MSFNPFERSSLPETNTSPERHEAMERRAQTFLVCPDNDAEAHMIILLAEKMGMTTLRSVQKHGATLEKEPDVMQHVTDSKKREVWIVEMPGPELEEQLRSQGIGVHAIDHHTYGQLDRATDPTTNKRKPSSLEQFLDEAKVTDEELRSWGYSPKTVKGLGIFDDRFAQGLRTAGYSQGEIAEVLDLGREFSKTVNPVFEEIQIAADADWETRESWNGYILVRSSFPRDVRGAISHRTIREGMDGTPLIVSSCGGKKIFIHNVEPNIVQGLKEHFRNPNTFDFGSGRCWGYDSKNGPIEIRLEEILDTLSHFPIATAKP